MTGATGGRHQRGRPLAVGRMKSYDFEHRPVAAEGQRMTSYLVGLRHKTRSKALTIDAEDALIAALKAKSENPDSAITYVRKSNRRGDHRHPHERLTERKTNRF